eukprot:scaffold131027_cov63-Phaeocystis_antarctica.AAC.1
MGRHAAGIAQRDTGHQRCIGEAGEQGRLRRDGEAVVRVEVELTLANLQERELQVGFQRTLVRPEHPVYCSAVGVANSDVPFLPPLSKGEEPRCRSLSAHKPELPLDGAPPVAGHGAARSRRNVLEQHLHGQPHRRLDAQGGVASRGHHGCQAAVRPQPARVVRRGAPAAAQRRQGARAHRLRTRLGPLALPRPRHLAARCRAHVARLHAHVRARLNSAQGRQGGQPAVAAGVAVRIGRHRCRVRIRPRARLHDQEPRAARPRSHAAGRADWRVAKRDRRAVRRALGDGGARHHVRTRAVHRARVLPRARPAAHWGGHVRTD